MSSVPVLGPAFWDEPPEEWLVETYRISYGRGITGRMCVYAASRGPDGRLPSAVWEALGEARVYRGDCLMARFPFYPRYMAEMPDYPGWSDAKNMAAGYAWRAGEEEER